MADKSIIIAHAATHRFPNPKMGIESRVIPLNSGRFAVRLRDTDANQDVNETLFYLTEEEAIQSAKEIAGV